MVSSLSSPISACGLRPALCYAEDGRSDSGGARGGGYSLSDLCARGQARTATASLPEDGSAPRLRAVALHYDRSDPDAPPVVTASGKGWMAEQILQLAFANGVKVRQDADLVQVLSALEVNSEIPAEAFAAVAEILAYVYKVNQKNSLRPSGHSGTLDEDRR